MKHPVAFFQSTVLFAGAEECLVTNIAELRARGVDALVFSGSTAPVMDRLEANGVPIVRMFVRQPRSGLRRWLGRIAGSLECRAKHLGNSLTDVVANALTRGELRALRATIERHQPSVLIGNMSALGDYQFLRLASNLGLGTVSHQQVSPEPWVGKRVVGELSRFCTEIYSNSAWTREGWIAKGLRADRHHVIYNRILPTAPATERLRDRLGLAPDVRLIASIGRLAAEKRFSDGIRAFRDAAGRYPGWHYVIIGEGDERISLEQEVAACGLGGRVHFTGQLGGAAAYLDQVDILLHPTPGEHFGRVVAEAMLRDAIAIGHASGGVLEMISDGETGFLFGRDRDLAATLAHAMSVGGDAGLKARARARIENLCGPVNTDRLAQLIENAARASRCGG
jgi:glycosyltransferase involved in cell wall biosynthesis